MRIGFTPIADAHGGGVYQYGQTMLDGLERLRADGVVDDVVVLANDPQGPAMLSLAEQGWEVAPLQPPPPPPTAGRRARQAMGRLVSEGPHREAWRRVRRRVQRRPRIAGELPDPAVVNTRPDVGDWLRQCGVDLMVYPTTTSISFEAGVPYIVPVHDLQHRLQPEFPEVSAEGQWQRREYLFRNATRYATLILVDSEVGKEDVLGFYGPYGVTADRVKILPFLPAFYFQRRSLRRSANECRASTHCRSVICSTPRSSDPTRTTTGLCRRWNG